jgi:hypothetical protein
MRFRPANISLTNRRHYLPRLLLILSLKYNDKNNPNDLQVLTGHTISISQLKRRWYSRIRWFSNL